MTCLMLQRKSITFLKSYSYNSYSFVSFDAVSLFTDVSLRQTVNIILKRVCQDNPIKTNLKKRSLKKLLIDVYF